MNSNQKISIGLVLIALATLAIAWYVMSTKWVSLMPGVQAGEVNRSVREKLLTWNIDYRLNDKTGEILIDEKQVSEVRNRLAQQGMSLAEDQGFEVFSKSEYGMSEFVQNLNYQRALEVELSRTISAIQGIKSAKVHLTFEKESLFKEKKKDAKASVVLELVDNTLLRKDTVKGIQQLVATSVPGLLYENVVVVDKQGTPVNVTGNKEDNVASNRIEQELHYSAKATELVSAIVPGAEVKVAVNVEYNNEKKHTVLEKFIPAAADGKGFVVKSKSSSEQAGGDPAATGQKDKKTNQEMEYQYSTEKSEVVYPDSSIAKITVALVVRHNNSRDLATDGIKAAVTHALGLDPERGDGVSITEVQLDGRSQDHVEPDAPEDNAIIPTAVSSSGLRSLASPTYLFVAVLVVGVLVVIVGILSAFRRRPKYSEEDLQKFSAEVKTWMSS